jgi:tetratricopeptide (TPR) repeat protein
MKKKPAVLVLFLLIFWNGSPKSQTVDLLYHQLNDQALKLIKSDTGKARELLTQAKEIKPEQPEAYLNLGSLFYQGNNYDEAAIEFRKALELCHTEDQKKLCLETINDITQLFRVDKEKELYQKAWRKIEERKSSEAIPLLEAALKLNPGNAKLYYEIGYAYVDLDRIAEAVPWLEKGRSLNPVHNGILSELKFCYADKGDLDKLKGVLKDLLNLYGDEAMMLHELAYAYQIADKTDSAIVTFENMLQKYPDSYFSCFLLGKLYYQEKKDKKRAGELMQDFLKGVRGKSFKEFKINPQQEDLNGLITEAEEILRKCRE